MPPKDNRAVPSLLGHPAVDVKTIPTNNPIRLRAFLNAELKLRGFNQRSLAKASGLPQQSINYAIDNPHERAECAFAELLKCHPADIWPSRFTPDRNIRLHRSRSKARPKHTSCEISHNV